MRDRFKKWSCCIQSCDEYESAYDFWTFNFANDGKFYVQASIPKNSTDAFIRMDEKREVADLAGAIPTGYDRLCLSTTVNQAPRSNGRMMQQGNILWMLTRGRNNTQSGGNAMRLVRLDISGGTYTLTNFTDAGPDDAPDYPPGKTPVAPNHYEIPDWLLSSDPEDREGNREEWGCTSDLFVIYNQFTPPAGFEDPDLWMVFTSPASGTQTPPKAVVHIAMNYARHNTSAPSDAYGDARPLMAIGDIQLEYFGHTGADHGLAWRCVSQDGSESVTEFIYGTIDWTGGNPVQVTPLETFWQHTRHAGTSGTEDEFTSYADDSEHRHIHDSGGWLDDGIEIEEPNLDIKIQSFDSNGTNFVVTGFKNGDGGDYRYQKGLPGPEVVFIPNAQTEVATYYDKATIMRNGEVVAMRVEQQLNGFKKFYLERITDGVPEILLHNLVDGSLTDFGRQPGYSLHADVGPCRRLYFPKIGTYPVPAVNQFVCYFDPALREAKFGNLGTRPMRDEFWDYPNTVTSRFTGLLHSPVEDMIFPLYSSEQEFAGGSVPDYYTIDQTGAWNSTNAVPAVHGAVVNDVHDFTASRKFLFHPAVDDLQREWAANIFTGTSQGGGVFLMDDADHRILVGEFVNLSWFVIGQGVEERLHCLVTQVAGATVTCIDGEGDDFPGNNQTTDFQMMVVYIDGVLDSVISTTAGDIVLAPDPVWDLLATDTIQITWDGGVRVNVSVDSIATVDDVTTVSFSSGYGEDLPPIGTPVKIAIKW